MKSVILKKLIVLGLICGSIASMSSTLTYADAKKENNIYEQEAVKLAGDNECSEEYKEKTSDWKKVNGRWTYYNGNSKEDQVKDRWSVINGYWYHFDENGYMQYSVTIKDDGGNDCILNKDGVLVNRDEPDINYLKDNKSNYVWKINNGNYYCFDKDGKMITGWVLDKTKWYYFNNEGIMQKNTTIIDGDKKYKLGPDGVWNGLFDGSDVVYDNTELVGEAVDEQYKIAWICIDGNWYAKRNGVKLTGLQKDENGKLFYMNDEGVLQTYTNVTVNGVKYSIDGSGVCKRVS